MGRIGDAYAGSGPDLPRPEQHLERTQEMAELKRARAAEGGLHQMNGLSLEQALIFQSYAAAVDRTGFTEQASSAAYGEAESLIAQLRDSDLARADLADLDFGDLAAIDDPVKRMSAALEVLKARSVPPAGGETERRESSPGERLERAKDALALTADLPMDAIRMMKARLQLEVGVDLKDRGEAHLTLIPPTAGKLLRDGLVSPEDLAEFDRLAGAPVAFEGIGTIPPGLDAAGIRSYLDNEEAAARLDPKKNKPKGVTFFAVVRLPDGVAARLEALRQKLNSVEPNPKKHVPPLRPHVTVGFTLKDRFDAEKTVNPALSGVALPEARYERLSVQKQLKDKDGKTAKGPDGNAIPYYEEF